MTAWHDQPPVSRRQVRQFERDEGVALEPTLHDEAPQDTSFSGIARQGWEAEARRSSTSRASADRSDAPTIGGRRAQQPSTNDRSMTDRAESLPNDQDPVEATPVIPEEVHPTAPVLTRRQMREQGIGGFSAADATDEAEIAAKIAAAEQAELAAEQLAAEQLAAEQAAAELVAAEMVAAEQAAAEYAVAERPRFRDRIRRGLVQSVDAESTSLTDPPALIEPPVRALFSGSLPTHSQATELPSVEAPVDPVESEQVPAAEITIAELVLTPEQASSYPASSHTASSHAASSVPTVEFIATPISELEADAAARPSAEASVVEESVIEDQIAKAPVVEETAVEATSIDLTAPAVRDLDSYVPPVGHWSTQASIDDDEQAPQNVSARDVAATSGAVTTSALVLPSMPTGEDLMGPLSATGEILITGSINLPSSMGTTGVHPARYDHSDVDALLEADDREDSDPDSAPVRAIRAISTHAGSGDVINSMKPQKNSRLPLILTVSAAVMATAVLVLLIAGFIFKIF